jgi:hypothetical protein
MSQLEGAGRKPLVGRAFWMRGREVLWVEGVFGRFNLLVPTEELVAFGLDLNLKNYFLSLMGVFLPPPGLGGRHELIVLIFFH